MEQFWDLLHTLMNPKSIIEYGGLALLIFVIFAETGLFFGFFLPGDSLLFIAGLLCATSEEAARTGGEGLLNVSIYTLILSIAAAGILGNMVGYWFGKRTGPVIFKRDDSLLFKKKYLESARDFYHQYGGVALILGRFMPFIRTFVPIFAGIVKVDYKKFMAYNISGSFLWVMSMTLSGYFLGFSFPQIQNYLEYIVIGIILVSVIPVVITFLRKRVVNK